MLSFSSLFPVSPLKWAKRFYLSCLVLWKASHDAAKGMYSLKIKQDPSPGSDPTPAPLHIPVVVGLLDSKTGAEILPSTLLEVKDYETSFDLEAKTAEPPVASLLRGFSAPVKLQVEQTEDTLAFLAQHDTDSFVRYA